MNWGGGVVVLWIGWRSAAVCHHMRSPQRQLKSIDRASSSTRCGHGLGRVYFPARQSRKADDNLHRPSPTYSLLERRKLHSRVRERVRCQYVSPPAVINLSQLTRVVASVGLLLECAEQFVIIPSTSSVDLSIDHNRDWRWHGGVA